MTEARLIEYRITRELLQRRNRAASPCTDRFILSVAAAAGIAVLGLAVPQLLLPVFLVSAVVTLGI